MALLRRTTNSRQPTPPPTQVFDEGIDWTRLASALKTRKGFVFLVTVLGTALGVAASRLVRPSYVIEARLWLEASNRRSALSGPIQSSQLFETNAWEELLRSYRVLEQVVRDQRLYLNVASAADSAVLTGFSVTEGVVPDEYVLRIDSTGTRFKLTTKSGRLVDQGVVGDSVGRSVGLRWAPPPASLRSDESLEFSVRTVRDAARDLAAGLQSQMDSKGNFLRVTLRGANPIRAAATLNAVIFRFVRVAGDLKRATLSERTRILSEQLDSARQKLTVADRALESFRVRTITLPGRGDGTGTSAGGDPSSEILKAYFGLVDERDELIRSRAALRQALAVADTGSFPVESLEGIPLIQQSTGMKLLLDELAKKRAELRDLRFRFTDQSQAVQQLLQEIEELEKGALPARVRSLNAELGRRQEVLDGEIAGRARSLEQIPPRVLEHARLTRDVTLSQELYGTLQKRYEEARLAEVSSIPDVRILDMAAVPQDPESRKAKRMIFMAFLATLGAGIFGAVILDRLDPRVRYPVQVTRDMGLTILGGIPHLKNGRGRRARENRAQLLEAFRTLRLSLVHSYGAAGPMLFTVTSPEQGDGKSFVATNLAGIFARQGQRVLLVDGDLRRGRQHGSVDGPRTPGLTEYLEGRAPIDEVIHHSAKWSLDFVPSGTPRMSSGELLTSRRLGQLVAHVKSKYEVIIIDTPPLRAGVDALALSTLAGNLLFVLRTGATDRMLAESKLDLLDRLPVRVLGAVLNDIRGQQGVYRHYAYDSYYQLTGSNTAKRPDGSPALSIPSFTDRDA